jgi:hypothetical protein
MSDIAQGVGFDTSNLPSYEELAKKIGLSDELTKASQALQTAQLTHVALSNYKPYKELTKTLSETIFDPLTAKFKQTVQEGASKLAGKFNPTGEGDGIASRLIQIAGDNPQELLNIVKNPKGAGKSLLNKAIEKSSLSSEEKALLKSVSEGKIEPKALGKQALKTAIDKTDIIPDELKSIAKSATEGKLPNINDAKNLLGDIVDKADVSDDVKALAKAAASGNRQTFMNAAKDRIGGAIDNSDLQDEVKGIAKSALAGENLTSEAKETLNTALDGSNLSPEIKSISKAIVSGSKKAVADEATKTLNNIVEKSNLSPEVKTLAKAAASGRVPTLGEAKSAMDSVLPDSVKAQLPEFENLSQVPSQIADKAKTFTELPKLAAEKIENRIGKMNSDLVSNLRQAGVNDEEIALNRDIDFDKLIKQAPQKLLDPSEFSVDAPDFDLVDAQKAYRASKYIESLSKPASETGGMAGDSTLARLIQGDVPTEIRQYVPKTKRDIKDAAKQRKLKQKQQEAGPAEEKPQTVNDVIDKPINENREISNQALEPYIEKLQSTKPVSEIQPAEETGVGVAGEETGAIEQASKSSSGIGKTLQEDAADSLVEDENPIGAGISAVLEIASLATMLGGIFAPKPKEPVIVGGYQSGV